jgi:hypothetical protein
MDGMHGSSVLHTLAVIAFAAGLHEIVPSGQSSTFNAHVSPAQQTLGAVNSQMHTLVSQKLLSADMAGWHWPSFKHLLFASLQGFASSLT